MSQDHSGARPGWVYLVGAGPGDPELITLRGAALLASATVVLHDELIGPEILAHAGPHARIVAVGKRGSQPPAKAAKQQQINQQLIELARQGEVVVRLKGGDPFLFGRAVEELVNLRAAGVPFEVVPGVCSPLAASAYAGLALTDRDHASSVTFVTAVQQDGTPFPWHTLRGLAGTLCILMGRRSLPTISRALMIDAGLAADTPAAVAQWASRPLQRVVVGTLQALPELAAEADIGTPSLILVGQALSRREQLSWYDAQPLFGKRVLVTRPAHQIASASALLRRRGANPVPFPTIAIEPPPDPQAVRRAIAHIADYQLVAFTSANGVDWFFRGLKEAGCDARVFGRSLLAAIGPATAAALSARGLRADIVAKTFVAEGLVEEIVAAVPAGSRVLLPRALVARELLPTALTEAGMQVDVVPVYQTLTATPERAAQLDQLIAGVDMVMLTSSSTAIQLFNLLGEGAVAKLSHCAIASIGPITTKTAESLGARVAVTAEVSTVPGLIDAMERAAERGTLKNLA